MVHSRILPLRTMVLLWRVLNLRPMIGLCFVGLCLLTRLPFQDTNVFYFDGDEAVTGLMALDILDGVTTGFIFDKSIGLKLDTFAGPRSA